MICPNLTACGIQRDIGEILHELYNVDDLEDASKIKFFSAGKTLKLVSNTLKFHSESPLSPPPP